MRKFFFLSVALRLVEILKKVKVISDMTDHMDTIVTEKIKSRREKLLRIKFRVNVVTRKKHKLSAKATKPSGQRSAEKKCVPPFLSRK